MSITQKGEGHSRRRCLTCSCSVLCLVMFVGSRSVSGRGGGHGRAARPAPKNAASSAHWYT
eukprot:scaffold365095_cov37-Prasinocladus_malaysianus.AAC.1